MPLAFYADECVDARIVTALRRRQVDVATAAEMALLGVPDERHLEQARVMRRPIITCDRDFLSLVGGGEADFPGLIFILPTENLGAVVRAILLIVAVLGPEDMADHIEWVP